MNTCERNLVYNSLSKMLMENESEGGVLDDLMVECTLIDARDILGIELGKDLVEMYGDDMVYESRTLNGYAQELHSLVEFIYNANKGKDKSVVAYDELVMHMLDRCNDELNGKIINAEGGGDDDCDGDEQGVGG